METAITYLVKAAIAIAAFYLFYLLVLRSRKDFRFNRIYLSASFFLSFLIPLITIKLVRPDSRQLVFLPEQTTPDVLPATPVAASPDVMTWIVCGFLLVTFFFLIRLITGYRRAFSIVRLCRVSEIDGIRVHISKDDIHPFTFFRKIVVPGSILNHPDQGIILKHELVHVKEKHTLDILSSEILFLLQWFNPFALMLKAAIRNNLEFLTDQEVVRESDMQRYQLAMVALAGKKGTTPFLNALNGSDLKNRIIMMKKKTENKSNFSRRLMVIPLLTILIAGLSNKEFKAAPIPANEVLAASLIGQEEGITKSDTVKSQKKEVVVIGYPAKKVYSTSSTKEEKAEGSGNIRIIGTEGQPIQEQVASSKANTGNQEVTVIGYGTKSKGNSFPGDSIKVRGVASVSGVQPLYILDGKEVSSLDGISPESIESISVLKNESATAVYGEKGKNGVILITSKKQTRLSNDPLIILDGKETTKKVAEVKPEDIQSVNVLKGESATLKYGEKGKNGVIEITMKSFTDKMIPGINTTQELRKHIAHSIRYPAEASENGQQGAVRIYAFVNSNGKITQITETKPKADIVPVDEVVVVAYAVKNDQSKLMKSSTSLNEEAALRVKNLPDLEIPELKNRWVEFQFKFVLQ